MVEDVIRPWVEKVSVTSIRKRESGKWMSIVKFSRLNGQEIELMAFTCDIEGLGIKAGDRIRLRSEKVGLCKHRSFFIKKGLSGRIDLNPTTNEDIYYG